MLGDPFERSRRGFAGVCEHYYGVFNRLGFHALVAVCALVDSRVAQRLHGVGDVLGFGELDGLVIKIRYYGGSVVLLDGVYHLRGHFCDFRELDALFYMVFYDERAHRRVLVVVGGFTTALVFGEKFRLDDFAYVVVERADAADHRVCGNRHRRVLGEERDHHAVVV